jgi:hypothetical protein
MIINFCWLKELTLHIIHLISKFEKKKKKKKLILTYKKKISLWNLYIYYY